jgi:hypothetical protein
MKTFNNALPTPFAKDLYNYALDRAEGDTGGYPLTPTWLSTFKWDEQKTWQNPIPTFGIELPNELKEKTSQYLHSHEDEDVVKQIKKRFKANLHIASPGSWGPPAQDTKEWFFIYLNEDWKFRDGGHLQWQIKDKSWKTHNPQFNTLAWNANFAIYSRTPVTEKPQVFLELTF